MLQVCVVNDILHVDADGLRLTVEFTVIDLEAECRQRGSQAVGWRGVDEEAVVELLLAQFHGVGVADSTRVEFLTIERQAPLTSQRSDLHVDQRGVPHTVRMLVYCCVGIDVHEAEVRYRKAVGRILVGRHRPVLTHRLIVPWVYVDAHGVFRFAVICAVIDLELE